MESWVISPVVSLVFFMWVNFDDKKKCSLGLLIFLFCCNYFILLYFIESKKELEIEIKTDVEMSRDAT